MYSWKQGLPSPRDNDFFSLDGGSGGRLHSAFDMVRFSFQVKRFHFHNEIDIKNCIHGSLCVFDSTTTIRGKQAFLDAVKLMFGCIRGTKDLTGLFGRRMKATLLW